MIGDDVTVGHGAILHACTVGDACLIGMGAIVLDGARVERNAFVGAGAVVRRARWSAAASCGWAARRAACAASARPRSTTSCIRPQHYVRLKDALPGRGRA
jgi:carbonic anhydrase/acetyltransferase-like protein (isoleucine patch superfamily)